MNYGMSRNELVDRLVSEDIVINCRTEVSFNELKEELTNRGISICDLSTWSPLSKTTCVSYIARTKECYIECVDAFNVGAVLDFDRYLNLKQMGANYYLIYSTSEHYGEICPVYYGYDGLLQGSIYDAIKYELLTDACKIIDKVRGIYSENEFDIIPIDIRVFGEKPRFVYRMNKGVDINEQ